MALIIALWMITISVAKFLEERHVKLYTHAPHNVPGNTPEIGRLDQVLREHKKRVAEV